MKSSERSDLVKSKLGIANLSCLANYVVIYLQLLVGPDRFQRGCAGKVLQMKPLPIQYAVQYMEAL